MSALIPAIINLIIKGMKSGSGGAGGAGKAAKPELSQEEKNYKHDQKRILEGDMTFGSDRGGGLKLPQMPTYQEIAGRRGR